MMIRRVVTAAGARGKVSPLRFMTPSSVRFYGVAQDVHVEDKVHVDFKVVEEEEEQGRKLKPKEVVKRLDQFIVGQNDAKRAVAIALRNRWRRQSLPVDLVNEVSPKNILMIGPTGCGKTEIARRLAKLAEAPFIKVEATKFTEVGFHGRDVDSIIRDLVDVSINLVKKRKTETMRVKVQDLVENRIIDALAGKHAAAQSRESFLRLLRAGELEERTILVNAVQNPVKSITFDPATETLTARTLGKVLSRESVDKDKKTMTVAEARPIFEDLEMEDALDMNDVTKEAVSEVEQNGIVFIDEIDKICNPSDVRSVDASAEGVQRDLLPIIEGSTVHTPNYGNVNTDHILFICSGAFHSCKPSDLLAELQGRLPIRVELKGLTKEDLHRILTEPINNLIRQQIELLKTEELEVEFTPEAISEIASVAFAVNKTIENIGARRLHTIVEKVVEELSFDACEMTGQSFVIDQAYVQEKVGQLLQAKDLSKFIL